MTPLAWIVLGCCCVFLAAVAVVVFGKDKYDAQIAAADATAPADLLHLAQLRDPGDGDDVMKLADAVREPPPIHPAAQRVRDEITARRQRGIGHALAEGHDRKTCPDCRELPR